MARPIIVLTTLVLVLAFNLNFYAQSRIFVGYLSTASKKAHVPENAIKNYAKAIESENTGLRKSAVYMAGVYKINGLVKTLMKQFTKEKDDDLKVMIALALYMIGDERGIAAIDGWQNN